MSNRITIDELESYLWNSAVLLRTSIDAGAYKQYIFPLLFFKRICDVYDEETEVAVEKYGDDIDDFDEEELNQLKKENFMKEQEELIGDNEIEKRGRRPAFPRTPMRWYRAIRTPTRPGPRSGSGSRPTVT